MTTIPLIQVTTNREGTSSSSVNSSRTPPAPSSLEEPRVTSSEGQQQQQQRPGETGDKHNNNTCVDYEAEELDYKDRGNNNTMPPKKSVTMMSTITQSPLLRRTNSIDTDSLTDSCSSSDLEEGVGVLAPPSSTSPAVIKAIEVEEVDTEDDECSVNTSSKNKGLLLLGENGNNSSNSNINIINIIRDNLRQNGTKGDAMKLCFGAAGIYLCYLAYGHLQEDVFRYRAADGSKFQQVWFLQVLECACNIVVGIVGRRVFGGRTPVSLTPFFQSGASQVFSKVLTSLSLAAGLSFPICTLAKSAKMVPVMLGQLVLGGSKYNIRDCIFAGAVVVGTTLLSMGKASSSASSAPESSSFIGLVFIIVSLVMDGVTGGLQKKLKKETEGQPPTTYDFLLFTNLSMGFVAFSIALMVGDFASGMLFMAQNPELRKMVVSECILSALGQSFIFYVVANFDPMVCATVTTTRKILSVMWSIAVKGHTVSNRGYAGLVIAILGVLLGLQEKLKKKLKKRQKQRQLKESYRHNLKHHNSDTPPKAVNR